ncbi:MAG TPA: DUF2188 domain-containing protein [Thermoanaerobaculia bacterium]|nr:DUF2188 domain-containing protein [Thermoanaerobaculia bacterium]
MAKNDVHTIPWKGRWANKRESQIQVKKTYRRQDEAISDGRVLARQSKAEHFIHRRDGTIRARNSYGHDPYPPKG